MSTMALLQISLEQVAQDTAGLSPRFGNNCTTLQKYPGNSSSLHDLSINFTIQAGHAGLVAALGGFCNEFSRSTIAGSVLSIIMFRADSERVTLCLFRIAQGGPAERREAQRRNGGEVELSGHGDRIDLCISDPAWDSALSM